jgi:hypothetical protein
MNPLSAHEGRDDEVGDKREGDCGFSDVMAGDEVT